MSSKKKSETAFNREVVRKKLRFSYPEADVIFSPEPEPTEAICEVEPASEHPEYSVAVVVLGKSVPHHHEITTETYEILSGSIELHLGSKALTLINGQSREIPPGTVHWAKAQNDAYAWIRVTSEPGWTSADHVYEDKDNRTP